MKILDTEYIIRLGRFGYYIYFGHDQHYNIVTNIQNKYHIFSWEKFLISLNFKLNYVHCDGRVIPEFELEKDAKRLAMLLSTNLLIDIR